MFAGCDATIADGFQFHVLSRSATGWTAAFHLNQWVPGLVIRMDFGGLPFQVTSVEYADKGVRDDRPVPPPPPF